MKNKIYLFVLVLAVAIIGFCNIVMAQSYGDTKVVASIENLDEEWIVVEKSEQNYTIKYVGGAKYGDIESTINKDMLPENWVVVDLGNTKTTSYIIKYIEGAANGAIQPVRFLENIPKEWKEYITIDGYCTIKYEGQTPVNINSDTGLYRYKYGDKDEGYANDCENYHNFWLEYGFYDYKFIGNVSYGTIEKLAREWLKSGWISIGVDESNNESKMKCIKNAKPGDIEYSKLTGYYDYRDYDYYLSDGWVVTHYNSTTREAVIKYLGKDSSKQYAYGDTLTSPHIKLASDGTPLPENWVSISADKIMYIGGRKSIGTKLDIYFSEGEEFRLPNSKNWVWFKYGKTILYVGTPAYGTKIDIDGYNNYSFWRSIDEIPKGWVYTFDDKSDSEKFTIKFLNGAKYGDQETISYEYTDDYCYNKLPEGWIIDDYDEVKKTCSIKYILGGADYGTQIIIKNYVGDKASPKLPIGWIVTTVDSESLTITCIEGAKFGDVQYMYSETINTDILPDGWVCQSYDELTSQLKLTYIKGDVPLYTEVSAFHNGCIKKFWDVLPDGWVSFARNDSYYLSDLKYFGENYPEIGQTIDFTLKDLNGNDVDLNTFKGRNTIIAYNWQNTNLNSIIEELPDVQVINISSSEEEEDEDIFSAVNYMLKDTERAFAEKYTYVRDNETTNGYAYTNWYVNPAYLFVDKDMKILSKKVQISEKEATVEGKRLFAPSTPEEEETSIILGDIDNTGSANSIDFGLMRQYLLGIINEFSYENGLESADVDGNGSFNSIDFAFMRQYLLGIIKEFPAQNKLVATPKATATPTITPTITPTPSPSGGLQIDSVKANPDALFVNQAEDVIFTAGISNFEYDSELTIELNKSDENGNIIEKLGILNDAGVDGDEKAGDNIYSFKKNMSYSTTQTLHFTVTATQDKVQRTAGVDLRVLNKVTDEEMKENCAFQEEQVKRYVELIASEGIESAKNVMLSELNSNTKIQQAGVSDGSDSIWFEYKNGILGAISIRKKDETDSTSEESVNTPTTDQTSAETVTTVDSNVENTDTLSSSGSNDKSILFSPESPAEVKGPRIANRKVLMLSPMLHEFGINDSNDMNSYTPNVYETLKKYKYNDADVFRDSDITYLKDKEVTISFLRTELYKYGVISLSSHGENLFQTLRSEPLWGMRDGAVGGQVGFFLAQSYEDSASTVEKDKILRDLQMHRLAIFTLYDEDKEKIIGSNYFVLPSFIEKYFQNIYVNNLVLMGCCKSAYNETMANAFIKSGARTYLGFSDYVEHYIARDRTSLFLSKFLEQSATAKSAYDAAEASVSSKMPTHPGQPPAQSFRIKFLGEPNLKPPVPFLDLGTLGGNSEARSINCKGQVVGMSKVGDQEFPVLWEDGDICKLNDDTSWAQVINDQSEIFMSYEGFVDWDADYFDYYSKMYTRGYIWNKGEVSYYSDHRYIDINDKGQKIGYYTDPFTYQITGFLIDNGTYKDLGNFIPTDINNKGQIVGIARIAGYEGVSEQYRSFLYENGVFTDLGSLNSKVKKVSFPDDSIESQFNYIYFSPYVSYPDTYGDTCAEAINEKGQIVGASYIGDDSMTQHAFLWENGVMKDLSTLGGENNWSQAYDINNEGVIVGGAGDSFLTCHPCMWKNSVMTDLRDVGTFGGIYYNNSIAYSINDLGQIAGKGYSGKAVLWTP